MNKRQLSSYNKLLEWIDNNSSCTLVSEEYVNKNTKMTFRCECGKEFIKSIQAIKMGYDTCNDCSKKESSRSYAMKVESRLNEESDIQSGEYIFTMPKFLDSETKISFFHKICGNEYRTMPKSFEYGYRCPECAKKSRGDSNRKTQSQFEKEVFDLVGNEYEVIGEYVNINTKIKMRHSAGDCNGEYEVSPSAFLRGNRCAVCRYERMSKEKSWNKSQFLEVAKNKMGNDFHEYEFVGEYINSQTKFNVLHKVCGGIWNVAPRSILAGSRCGLCSRNKQKTDDIFKQEIENLVGEEYQFLDNYVNAITKLKVKHCCKECDNHEYHVTPNDFLSKGTRCPHPVHIAPQKTLKTNEIFIEEVRDLTGDEYTVVGEYVNAHNHISIRHESCGYLWNTTPHNFLQGARCLKCYKGMPYDETVFKKEVNDMWGQEYEVLGDYSKEDRKVSMRHNICGKEYRISRYTFLKGVRCSDCHGGIRLTNEQFLQKLTELRGKEFTPLESYKTAVTSISFLHNECGREFVATSNAIFSGNGCPHCARSKGEKAIDLILRSVGVKYIPEYRDKRCKYKHTLPFDFALMNDKDKPILMIEYDGQHHFEIGHYNNTEADLAEVKTRDGIKNKFCLDNNIPLLRIPYWEFENIEYILFDKLIELNILEEATT